MKFILWTLVWWGILFVGDTTQVILMGGWKSYSAGFSPTALGLSAIIEMALWIFLYVEFIRTE